MTVGRPPRVLIDATSVPADRGGVGRYVDGLLGALDAFDVNLAVVCQRADTERYSRLLHNATIIPAPAAVTHRPALRYECHFRAKPTPAAVHGSDRNARGT